MADPKFEHPDLWDFIEQEAEKASKFSDLVRGSRRNEREPGEMSELDQSNKAPASVICTPGSVAEPIEF